MAQFHRSHAQSWLLDHVSMNDVGVSEDKLPKLIKVVLYIAEENYESNMLKIFLQDNLVDLMPTAKVSGFVKEFVTYLEEQARSARRAAGKQSSSSSSSSSTTTEKQVESSGMINFSDSDDDSENEITLGEPDSGDFEDDDKFFQEEDDEYGRIAKRARGGHGPSMSSSSSNEGGGGGSGSGSGGGGGAASLEDGHSTKKATTSAWGGLGKKRESLNRESLATKAIAAVRAARGSGFEKGSMNSKAIAAVKFAMAGELGPQRPPPPGYLCKICQVPGHWIKECPRHSSISSTSTSTQQQGEKLQGEITRADPSIEYCFIDGNVFGHKRACVDGNWPFRPGDMVEYYRESNDHPKNKWKCTSFKLLSRGNGVARRCVVSSFFCFCFCCILLFLWLFKSYM